MMASSKCALRDLTGATVAVRPNLNRAGALTGHPVGVRGGVRYGTAIAYSDRGEGALLAGCRTHESASQVRAAVNRPRTPCGSVVGTLVATFPQGACPPTGHAWQRCRYEPGAPFTDAAGRPFTRCALAYLERRRLWAVDPRS